MTTAPGTPADGAPHAATTDRGGKRFDTTVVHPARRYNYWLGGKDNLAADRLSGDQIAAVFPQVVEAARENRRFMQRAVTYLAAETGVRQFLDIGTGFPFSPNVHELAQAVDPTARIVYVDNDRWLPGSMHTWAVLRKGASRVARGGVRTGQHGQSA
jgi:hypothetical protein